MSDYTCTWNGASGTVYLYYVFERAEKVPSRLGNYVYSKKNQDDLWVPIYMGHGDLSVCASGDPGLLECIDAKGATHLHLRLNALEEDRVIEMADILPNYPNALVPEGCHVREAPGAE